MNARTQKRAVTPSLPSNASGSSSTQSLTTVINIRNAPEGWRDDSQYVYIGRHNSRYHVKSSKWANPYKIGRDGTREQVIALYRAYVSSTPRLSGALSELKGKTLVCWCAPQPCHGDVLAELAEDAGAQVGGGE